MPQLVTTEILKDELTEFRRRCDLRWLKRTEAEEMMAGAIDSGVGPLTIEELEEVLDEIGPE